MNSRVTVVIDTTSSYSILAILRDKEVLYTQIVTEPKTLLRQIGLFSLQASAEISRVEGTEAEIVLCIGPSGFSGGRIGVTTGRSLALGWGISVMPFDHLGMISKVIEEEISHDIVIEDAKGGEVHFYDARSHAKISTTVNCDRAKYLIGDLDKVVVVGDLPQGLEDTFSGNVELLDVAALPIEAKLSTFVESIRPLGKVSPQNIQIRYGRDYIAVANFERLR
ncbi:MAG: hypothetical protein M0Z45_08305 [Actinomycetota bacterium]|nr:hypothetical protein [Actinomycetota bacterium]